MKRVLVVCLGNICRSPIGEELLRHHAEAAGFDLFVDSAGTSGWHQGNPPDPRSCAVMLHHGHDIAGQHSRPLLEQDLFTFDHILVMDSNNLIDAQSLPTGTAQIQLFVDGRDVPDPYYGEGDGFQLVYDMLNAAAQSWIQVWSG